MGPSKKCEIDRKYIIFIISGPNRKKLLEEIAKGCERSLKKATKLSQLFRFYAQLFVRGNQIISAKCIIFFLDCVLLV